MLPGQTLTDEQKLIIFVFGHYDEAKIVAGAIGSLYNRVNASHAWEVPRKLDFRRAEQVYEDTMRGEYRTCRRRGACVVCLTPIHGFDDGENDPCGPLGLRADASLEPADYGYDDNINHPVPLCYGCSQERERYEKALCLAKTHSWTKQEGVTRDG